MKQFEEILQSNNIYNREFCLLQYVVMLVVSDYIARIGSNGAINKLVVVWV